MQYAYQDVIEANDVKEFYKVWNLCEKKPEIPDFFWWKSRTISVDSFKNTTHNIENVSDMILKVIVHA